MGSYDNDEHFLDVQFRLMREGDLNFTSFLRTKNINISNKYCFKRTISVSSSIPSLEFS